MKKIVVLFVLIQASLVKSQEIPPVFDTISSGHCSSILNIEYTKKFESFNNSLSASKSPRAKIIKETYREMQKGFIENIYKRNFMCEKDAADYLNILLQEILHKNGIAEDDFKILLSRNSSPNAYNTGDGTIVINYGLFMILDDEDELMFVIAHELGHQFLNHVKKDIDLFAELSTSEAVLKNTKAIREQKYGKATSAGNLLKSITYQNYHERRKKEFEADSIGLIFYNKILRNQRASINILRKLDHADEEKQSLESEDYKAIFEKNDFKLRHSDFEEEESIFTKYDNESTALNDSLKTHPSCLARIEKIQNELGQKTSAPISVEFNKIKAQSISQNLYNLYFSERYGLSLYEALKLYKNDSGNKILESIIYLNLKKIMDAKISHTINRFVPRIDHKYNSESLNRFIVFVNNIRVSDIDKILNNFKS